MSRQDKNKKLIDNNVYYPSMEHEWLAGQA